MSNHWFQFKQFQIVQDKCGMKVSTDACIQGAEAARFIKSFSIKNVLDIGTGTGLLSLMVVQQNPEIVVDAIDIDENAIVQAKENFSNSPWPQAFKAIHTSLKDWHFSSVQNEKKYDFIISNPPFFDNSLQAAQHLRNQARHSFSLSKNELFAAASDLLSEDGLFCVLYPFDSFQEIETIAKQNELYLFKCLQINPNLAKNPNRVVLFFTKKENVATVTEELIIYANKGIYTDAFCRLLSEYYLTL